MNSMAPQVNPVSVFRSVSSMFTVSGECSCGLKREIECDDPSVIQAIKDTPCIHCGGKLKYKTAEDK